ncbi:TPA: VirK/YbjX family protein [Photobacterium damselae]
MINNQLHFRKILKIIYDKLNKNPSGINKILKNIELFFWTFINYKNLKKHIKFFYENKLHCLLDIHPKIIKKPFKSYICSTWDTQQRIDAIQEHFKFIKENINQEYFTKILTTSGYKILKIKDINENIYNIQLNRGQQREGSLGISIENSHGQRIYATTINFKNNDLYIGSIQGPNDRIDDRQQVIKNLTKSCYGLRPKALILELVLMLAREFHIKNVYGISTECHMYQSWRYFGRKRGNIVTFDYNTYWLEFGSIKADNHFYKIPLVLERKDLSQLNRNKRKLYTKRYAWLDELEQSFCQNLTPLKK